MTTEHTLYDIGDTIVVDGIAETVVSAHLYINTDGTITERYFLGRGKWFTVNREVKRRKCRTH
jgi:hypothetical protein